MSVQCNAHVYVYYIFLYLKTKLHRWMDKNTIVTQHRVVGSRWSVGWQAQEHKTCFFNVQNKTKTWPISFAVAQAAASLPIQFCSCFSSSIILPPERSVHDSTMHGYSSFAISMHKMWIVHIIIRVSPLSYPFDYYYRLLLYYNDNIIHCAFRCCLREIFMVLARAFCIWMGS